MAITDDVETVQVACEELAVAIAYMPDGSRGRALKALDRLRAYLRQLQMQREARVRAAQFQAAYDAGDDE